MRNKFKILLIALLFSATSAHAVMSPLAISIIPPVQFPPSQFTVTGLRLSGLWGAHQNMYGLDFGLLGNTTSHAFTGLAASGVFNYNSGTSTVIGLQFATIANITINKANIYGFQIAAVNSNKAESMVLGFQIAAVNLSDYTKVNGFQVGVYNKAYVINGLQIGLVNVADDVHGLQIGLINFNHKGLFSVSPFLNAGF